MNTNRTKPECLIRVYSWPDLLTYQTLHACSRTIFCPALQENAFPNSGILLTTPLIRYSFGECGFVTALTRLLSGRSSPQAHCAIPMKNRWSGVNPPTGLNCLPPVASFHAIYARIVPPRSAVSSPSVSLPLILISSTTVYCEYWFAMQLARSTNSSASFFVHQSRRFPVASNCRPSSSNPCVSSCPMVAPVFP